MATADPELDPTKLNEPGAGGGDDGDETLYLSPITKTSTTYEDPDDEEETSFGGDETRPLIERESDQDKAWYRIKSVFPKFNIAKAKFIATMDEWGRVIVRLRRSNAKQYVFFKADGDVNDEFMNLKDIRDNLGPTSAEAVEANDGEDS